MKKVFHQLLLFSNAFLIMNVLFLVKEIYLYCANCRCTNWYIFIGIIFICISIVLGVSGFFVIYRKTKGTYEICNVVKKQNLTGDFYFGYFSLFVLLFMNFNLDDIINLILYFVLIIILAIVYCSNRLFYINPTLMLLGKRIYTLQVKFEGEDIEVKAITSQRIEINKEYKFYFSQYEFTVCEESSNKI